MRRYLIFPVAFVLLGTLLAPATARTLTVRTDPNDTFQPPDVRKTWSDLSSRYVYLRIGSWDRMRERDARFIVVLDTRGEGAADRIVEIVRRQCLAWKAGPNRTLGRFIGEREATRPDGRSVACRLPVGWFGVRKTVSFVVRSGSAGEQHRDRAPNEGQYEGL